MTTINKNQIKSVIDENQKLKNDLISLQNQQYDLEHRLSQIYSAKSFKLWQKLNKIKKIKPVKYLHIFFNMIYTENYLVNQQNKNNQQTIINQQINKFYPQWISDHSPNIEELIQQKTQSKKLGFRPKISIITPTYNTPPVFLKECIRSIINQTYDNWELCLADDNSSDKTTRNIIKKFAVEDKRIRYVFRSTNGHICNASNSALKISTGDYIALLDHDDILLPNALFEFVKELNNNPNLDFIYSDEDKLSEDGITPTEPYFKPNWSPDKLFGFMYVGHLSMYKKSIIEKAGHFTVNTQGAQDYDLLLKSLIYIKNISHIQKILYRWRRHPNSTSTSLESKPYAMEAGKKALLRHLNKQINGKFDVYNPNIGFYSLTSFSIPSKSISVFINKKHIQKLPDSIIKNLSNKLLDINSFESISELNIQLKNSKALYFLVINHKVQNHYKGNIIDFIGYLNIKNVGIISPKIINQENKIVSAGISLIDGNLVSPHLSQFDSYGYANSLAVQADFLGVDSSFFAITNFTYSTLIKNFDTSLPQLYLLKKSIELLPKHFRTVLYPQLTITINNYKPSFPKKEVSQIKQLTSMILKKVDPYFNKNLIVNKQGSILLNQR